MLLTPRRVAIKVACAASSVSHCGFNFNHSLLVDFVLLSRRVVFYSNSPQFIIFATVMKIRRTNQDHDRVIHDKRGGHCSCGSSNEVFRGQSETIKSKSCLGGSSFVVWLHATRDDDPEDGQCLLSVWFVGIRETQ